MKSIYIKKTLRKIRILIGIYQVASIIQKWILIYARKIEPYYDLINYSYMLNFSRLDSEYVCTSHPFPRNDVIEIATHLLIFLILMAHLNFVKIGNRAPGKVEGVGVVQSKVIRHSGP